MDTRYDIFFSTPTPESIATLHAVCAPHASCYTLQAQHGSWDGVPEHAYAVILIGDSDLEATAITLAKVLKERFHQESVLVTKTAINAVFI